MRRLMLILVVVVAISASVALIAAAANGLATYAIPWWSVDGGGGTSQGGSYTLSGTAGQHDAGYSSGDGYSVSGGIWQFKRFGYEIYLPMLIK